MPEYQHRRLDYDDGQHEEDHPIRCQCAEKGAEAAA
jgi:hypothetical protein